MRGRRKGGRVVRAAQGGAGRGVAGWPCTSARNNMPCGPIIVGAEHVMAVRHASPSSSTSIQRGLEEGLGELMEVMVMVMERCWAAFAVGLFVERNGEAKPQPQPHSHRRPRGGISFLSSFVYRWAAGRGRFCSIPPSPSGAPDAQAG